MTKERKEQLIEEWKLVYAQSQNIDKRSDHDGAEWESLCVGWCLAKGLTVNQAFKFYSDMIPLNLF